MNILIVEDDPGIARAVGVNLELEGFKHFWASSLKQAHDIESSENLDLVLLDLGLGTESGFDFLKYLRDKSSRLPVIILSAKTDEDSVVKGLELGANDYLRKPFGNKELLARIKTVTNSPKHHDEKISYGGIKILKNKRQVLFGTQDINLNRREYDLFLYMIERAESIVSRNDLLSSINEDGDIFDRTIDSHISHLRKKLRKQNVTQIKIRSVYGLGYRLEKIGE